MSRYNRYANEGPAHWPAMIGLGLITLATVTNFALAGMTQSELLSLPAFVAIPYEIGGRLGVTMILVALGLAVIIGGQISYQVRRLRQQADPWSEHVQKYTALVNLPSRGGVQLETAKYLTPPGPMVFAEEIKEEEPQTEEPQAEVTQAEVKVA